jgi:hypothetical protein
VLLDHNEQELAAPRGYERDADVFATYLKDGKAEFLKRKSSGSTQQASR